jgi:tyrosyl-tRNA synthetase
MKNDFLKYIKSRGYLHQCTNDKVLDEKLNQSKTGYIGFDCTSDCLHVGSLLPLMLLRSFQKFGHTPIILLGGGTTLVGDPSGKDETRKILSEDDINNNKKKLKKIFERFLSFTSSNKAIIVDNYEWLINLNYISFLREIGSKFSVNKMLSLESIKQRLGREQNLSFLEFNYSLLQAYDFFELQKRYNCEIQFGGSDQWGNIVSGIDLVRKLSQKEVFGVTTPLVTTSNGKKMGKTEDGAVWLSEEKLDVNQFWQFWRNTSDKDIINFLYLFTEIEYQQIEEFKKLKGSELNEVKILLANEVTKLCHNDQKSKKAEKEAELILTAESFNLQALKDSKNKITYNMTQIENGLSLKQSLLELKFCKSNGEAKRLIDQGAVKINKEVVKDKDFIFTKKSFLEGSDNRLLYVIIYVGKKKFGVVELIT